MLVPLILTSLRAHHGCSVCRQTGVGNAFWSPVAALVTAATAGGTLKTFNSLFSSNFTSKMNKTLVENVRSTAEAVQFAVLMSRIIVSFVMVAHG